MGDLVRMPISEVMATLEKLDHLGVNPDHPQRIRTDVNYAKVVADHIIRGGTVREAYSITVDYGLSLEQMIAVGHYNWVNPQIKSEYFPVEDHGEVILEPQLIPYAKGMSSKMVLTDIDQRGLRPGTLPELLAFGAKYPNLQRKYPIAGLGSIWLFLSGCCLVPCLCVADRKRRDLDLHWFDVIWVARCRFLVFLKQSLGI